MTCDFTFFSTIFQSYRDDRRVIMKGCGSHKNRKKDGVESEQLNEKYIKQFSTLT